MEKWSEEADAKLDRKNWLANVKERTAHSTNNLLNTGMGGSLVRCIYSAVFLDKQYQQNSIITLLVSCYQSRDR